MHVSGVRTHCRTAGQDYEQHHRDQAEHCAPTHSAKDAHKAQNFHGKKDDGEVQPHAHQCIHAATLLPEPSRGTVRRAC
jgi:hypothetical protein